MGCYVEPSEERTRGERRRNNYNKAKRFKDILVDTTYASEYFEEMPLGKFVKNTSFNETPGFSGWDKTKNKGPNHNGTYAPTHNYKHSDKKKLASMDEDWSTYEDED